MTQVITVKDNKRHIKRKMHDALGNDLVKILTELITNSDDSYRRLQKNEINKNRATSQNPIYINIYKNNKRVEVIDNAEGMDSNDVIKNFQSYGADKSGRSEGHKTRGLFGQGASDVLFTQEDGTLLSIKNNKIIKAQFYWDGDERKISTDESLPLQETRKKYNIPNNGSVISFTLNEKTKFQNNFSNKLSHFYMLRFVMNDKNRSIIIKSFNDKGIPKEERLYYEFPPINNGDSLCSEQLKFKYEKKEFDATLEIYSINKKNEKYGQYGDLRLLIHDNENNVYDNTFFKLGEKYPGMEHMFGYLKLNNTAEIIREKLNAEIPEEILTDSRDGLNTRHEFYKILSNQVEPILEKYANKLNKGEKNALKSDDFKEHKKMFKELNKYLNEELDEINETGSSMGVQPPADGFSFIRERVKITTGKKYALKLLVNPLVIESGTSIIIENEDDDYIGVSPELILVSYEKDRDDIILYNIVLDAKKITEEDCCLTAKTKDGSITKKVYISVVSEEFYYPKYGMEFKPNYLSTIPDHDAKLHLYVDTNKYKIGSQIEFTINNSRIDLKNKKIILGNEHVIFENLAKIDVVFSSKHNDISGKIIACCNNYTTEADIEISDSIKSNEGKSGLISGWEFNNNPEAEWQKYLHPKTGKIIINSGNLINKYYFGEEINQNKIDNNKVFQKYLAELITDEVAKFMVKKQIDKGQLGRDYEEAIEEHQRRKNNLANIIYKYIVI